ncbi:MAG: hypothetical protein ACLGG0_08650 [Bacteriovoracia bacterium]
MTKILAILSLWLVVTHSYAMSSNDALFIALANCDLAQAEHHLKNGADSNALWRNELVGETRMYLTEGSPVLVFAVYKQCFELPTTFENIERNVISAREHGKKAISLLMKYGAKAEQLFTDYDGQKIPVLHAIFKSDIASMYGSDYFFHMVREGAEPKTRNEFGNTVLKYDSFYRDEEELKKYLLLGLSFFDTDYQGHSHIDRLFTFGFSDSFLDWLFGQLIQESKKLTDFTYIHSEYAHPLKSHFAMLLNRTYEPEAKPTYDQSTKRFKDRVLPFFKSIRNFPSGPQSRPILAEWIMLACPTVEMNGLISFNYKPGGYPYHSPTQAKYLEKNYHLLLELISTQDFDLTQADSEGRDILTYALNLCPFEVVQALVKKDAGLIKREHTSELLKNYAGLSKSIGTIAFLNNDHRTLEYLKSLGLQIDQINFASLGVTNNLILKQSAVKPWRELNSVGLNIKTGAAFNLKTVHAVKKFTDIKRTVINLSSTTPRAIHRFNGVSLGVYAAATPISTMSRGLRVFPNHTAIEYEVKNGLLTVKFKGGFEHQSQVSLTEVSSSGSGVLIIEETRTQAADQLEYTFYDQLSLLKGVEQDISKNNAPQLYLDTKLRYQSFGSVQDCSLSICEALVIRKQGDRTFVKIDSEKLKRTDVTIAMLWDYINSSPREKRDFLKDLLQRPVPQFLAFVPALMEAPMNSDKTEELKLLYEVLFQQQIVGRLNYDINSISEVMKQFELLNPKIELFVSIRHDILSGRLQSKTYDLLKQDIFELRDFILWTKTVRATGKYEQIINTIKNQIKNDLNQIGSTLGLSNEEIDELRRLL